MDCHDQEQGRHEESRHHHRVMEEEGVKQCSSRRQPEPPSNQQSLARPKISLIQSTLVPNSNNSTTTRQQELQEQLDQQEKQANENACVEFVQLQSNDAYMDEKRRIMELHDQQEGFRDEKAAIMSHLREADGNKPPGRQPEEEEEAVEQQSIISSSSRRTPPAIPSADTNDTVSVAQPSPPSLSLSRWTRRLQRKRMIHNGGETINDTQQQTISESTTRPGAVQENYPAFYRLPAWAYQRYNMRSAGAETGIIPDSNLSIEEAMTVLAQQEEPESASVNNEREQQESKRATQIILVVSIVGCVIVLALSIGLGVGLSGILRNDDSSSRQDPTLTDACEIDYSAICQQQEIEGDTFIVPDCAKTTYQMLINEFFFNSSFSTDSVAIINATDNVVIVQPCEPSFLALLSLAVANTTMNTHTNDRVRKYKQEYYALATLYFSTGGPNWDLNDNWLEDPDICVWFGVTCSLDDSKKALTEVEVDGGVNMVELQLDGNGIVGTIPTEIGLLSSSLTRLFLGENRVGGTMPSEIGMCTKLNSLQLRNNRIGGTLPTELGNLFRLQDLNLSFNQFTGGLPTQIWQLDQLEKFIMSNTELNGTIPTEIGKLERLKILILNENRLRGTIPTEIGNLASIQEFEVQGNPFLGGTLPTEMGNMRQMQRLIIEGAPFQGTLPTEVGKMELLGELNLRALSLTGTIPTEVSRLTNLISLVLPDNRFTGRIPTEIGNLSRLKSLNLSFNRLGGTFPSFLSSLPFLSEVSIEGNEVTGMVEDSFCVNLEVFRADFCPLPQTGSRRVKCVSDNSPCCDLGMCRF